MLYFLGKILRASKKIWRVISNTCVCYNGRISWCSPKIDEENLYNGQIDFLRVVCFQSLFLLKY